MHVVIPTSGDPGRPRPSGILSYALGLARFLIRNGVTVEFLSAGAPWSSPGMTATPVSLEANGEVPFVRALRRHVRVRSFPRDTIVVANSELYAWAFRRVRPRRHIVLISHGPTFPTLRSRRRIRSLAFRRFVEPPAVGVSTAIVAIDAETREYFSRRYPRARIHQIPLAIDTEQFHPLPRGEVREKWGVDGRPAILFVGRFAPEKNPGLAVEAFHIVRESRRDAVLLVAGDGPYSWRFEDAVRTMGADAVRLLGTVSWKDLSSLYSAADALILTSTIEQLPTVALEALACGTPVFSTAVGEIPSILTAPALGAICPATAQEFASALVGRIPETADDRARCGDLRRAVAQRYSWDVVGPQILGVLKECLQTEPS